MTDNFINNDKTATDDCDGKISNRFNGAVSS